ncbi:MAG: phosphoglycerate dehydrogenase [Halanaerobiaceae bacterium]|nr:phosphoglycerate dehydrogenase [Halanaerobiaceae bacterium]
MCKVLVSDYVSDAGIKLLEEHVEVYYNHKLSREEFLDIIGEYDGMIVRIFTQLDKEALDRAVKLKVIGRAGTGFDNIDLEEASKKGIIVFNTPTGNTISAAEHTMAMMLSLARNVPQANSAMHKGIWDRKRFNGVELKDKTLGIIGLGRIGSKVAKYAQAFGMKVVANDPYLPVEKAEILNVPLISFDELLERSDFITLHTPLTEETYHILDKEAFEKMKDGVRIINVARGKNLDSIALAEAIDMGKVAGAALDVHEEEPLPVDHPLLKFEDKVIVTCHLGGTTTEAMDNVSISAAEQVIAVLKEGKLPESPLNIFSFEPEYVTKAKPYLALIKKLSNFLAKWQGQERIKRIEIEYGGEILDLNLKPLTTSVIKDILDPILDDRVNLVNAYIVAKERGIKIKESRIEKPDGLSNFIRITLQTEKGVYTIAGTVLPIGTRVIEINNYRIDLNLEGKFLVAIYKDKPGVIGKLGTILGNEGVNIANMQVGRKAESGEAIMIVQTDSSPDSKTMDLLQIEKDFIEISYLEI